MKVLFLDIDGVLNSLPFMASTEWRAAARQGGHAGIDAAAVARLNRIVEQTGAIVIVSSTWRLGTGMSTVRNRLRAAGFTGQIKGRTPDLATRAAWGGVLLAVERRDEIRAWIAQHDDVEAYAILDDDEDARIDGHFVHTVFASGLTDEGVADAIRILGVRP